MEANGITYELVKGLYQKKGYKFYDKQNYDCNFFGIRSKNIDQSADKFDDVIGLCFLSEGLPICIAAAGTTDPSLLNLQDPQFPEAQKNGTAILCEGYYPSVYQLGMHGRGAWQHDALVQVGKFRIFRDNNRDEILDFDAPITEGVYGMNLHMAHPNFDLEKIGYYSAGCQVVQNGQLHRRMMFYSRKQIQALKVNKFSYALFNESDL